MLIVIYKIILYLLTWSYSSDITSMQRLGEYVKYLSANRIHEQFRVKLIQ